VNTHRVDGMCAHTPIPIIEGWGNPNHIQNVVEKTEVASQKCGKID